MAFYGILRRMNVSKNPEFEAKHKRGPRGRFASGSNSGQPKPAALHAVDLGRAASGDDPRQVMRFPEVERILGVLPERFHQHGHQAYLVGGSVRDNLLGDDTTADDIDITTDALPDQIHAISEGWADTIWDQGKRFGTVALAKNGHKIEITTHRSEGYTPDTRKPEVELGTNLLNDLARRDFTINAVAVDLRTWQVEDPFGGRADLVRGILRTPLPAEIIFSDDPLRMLRAARFTARFGLEPDISVVKAMSDLKDRMSIVSVERIEQEMDKMFSLPNPTKGFDLMIQTGMADQVLPGLTEQAMKSVQSVPHTCGTAVRLAVLISGHQTEDSARQALRSWHMSKTKTRQTLGVLKAARAVPSAIGHGLPEKRRWLVEAGPHADDGITAFQAITGQHREAAAFSSGIAELRSIEPDLGEDVLDGTTIAETLNVQPGPVIGEAKSHLAEERIRRGPLTNEQATSILTKWAAQAVSG